MMSRRTRTEVLVESAPSLAHELARALEAELPVRVVVPSRQGLVMNQVRETARNSRFYLGEALMSECRVRIGDVEGLGVVLGADGDLARSLAVIDAAYACEPAPAVLADVDARIAAAGRALDAERAREAALIMGSRVSFDEMGGQDMSVQAVVK